MPDTDVVIAQTVKELMQTNKLEIQLVLQAIQTGYTLGLAQGQKPA